MSRLFRCGGLLLLSLVFVVPTMIDAQEKKVDDPKTKEGEPKTKEGDPKTKSKDKEKIKPDWKGEIVGKLTQVDDKDETGLEFTAHVTYKVAEANPDGAKQLQQAQQSLLQHQQQLAKAKNAQERANAFKAINDDQVNIAKAQGNLIKYKDVNEDHKFKEKEGIRIRYHTPPAEIDVTTGEIIDKKLSKEDLEKARGPEGYPGYKADKKILKVGQMVKVFVHKDAKPPDVKKDKSDDAKTALANYRPEVIMIFVAADPAPETKK